MGTVVTKTFLSDDPSDAISSTSAANNIATKETTKLCTLCSSEAMMEEMTINDEVVHEKDTAEVNSNDKVVHEEGTAMQSTQLLTLLSSKATIGEMMINDKVVDVEDTAIVKSNDNVVDQEDTATQSTQLLTLPTSSYENMWIKKETSTSTQLVQ